MAKGKDGKGGFYSYLLVDKTRRRQLILLTLVSLAGMTALINYGIAAEKPWLQIGMIAVLLGLPLMALPLSEAWAYEPWQAESQKVEQHYRN